MSIEDIERENEELLEMQFNQLEDFLGKLPENERIILLMRYWDDLSIREIGDILNLQQSAVKMRIKRSRDHLARLFKSARS